MVIVAWQGRWHGVLVLTGFTIAELVFLLKSDRPPALVNLLVVMAGLVNAAGFVWDLYQKLWWFDEAVHLYTLFALTLLLGTVGRRSLLTGARDHRLLAILAVASFGVAIGALWEIAEWGYDRFTPGNSIKGKRDTIIDMIMDSIGAVIAGWLSGWVERARDY